MALSYLVAIVQIMEFSADLSSAQDMASLLFVALRVCSWEEPLRLLVSMPAAKQLDQEVFLELLKDAVRNTEQTVVNVFLEHPTAQAMLPWCLGDLLIGAQKGGRYSTLSELCQQPAAQHIDSPVLGALLQGALRDGKHDVLSGLCHLPAAHQIELAVLEELLRAAVEGGGGYHTSVSQLCHLVAAQQGEVSVVSEELLREAVKGGDYNTVSQLCQLPGVQLLGVSVLEEMLRVALAQNMYHILHALVDLPAAKQIAVAALGKLFRVAVNRMADSSGDIDYPYGSEYHDGSEAYFYDKIVRRLCNLLAKYQSFSQLLKLPAAQQLQKATLEKLFMEAMRPGNIEIVMELCELPAALDINLGEIEGRLGDKAGNCLQRFHEVGAW
jgi:hypothetical protein